MGISICLPIKDSQDKDKRAEQHQLQDPPVADQVGNARQDHESKREKRVADNGAEGKLRRITPLSTFKAIMQIERESFLPCGI